MGKDVIGVAVLDDQHLQLTFEGGERRVVDISAIVPFDGVFEPLRDPAYFRLVRVEPEAGSIVWPNGADLCPDVLYESGVPVTPGRPEATRV